MALISLFTASHFAAIRSALAFHGVEQGMRNSIVETLTAETITVPDPPDRSTLPPATVSYTRAGALVRTTLKDAQTGLDLIAEAPSTGELLAMVTRHPEYKDRMVTLQEAR